MSTIGNIYRIGGLATGIDTDDLVSKLMKVERIPLDRLDQKKQLLQWRRDSYREITNTLRAFYDDYFNVLKPSSNMTSQSVYKKYSAASNETDLVTATATSNAVAGTHTIRVKQLAEAANVSSSSTYSPVTGADVVTSLDFTDGLNNNLKITLDGNTETFTIDSLNFASYDDLVTHLQTKIDAEFGAGQVTVSHNAGELSFSAAKRMTITHDITNNSLTKLKVTSGQANFNSVTAPLQGNGAASLDYTDGNNKFSVTLDGVTKTISLKTASVYSGYDDLVTNTSSGLQKLVNDAFGADKVNVSIDSVSGILSFSSVTGSNNISLASASSNDALSDLEFTSGVSNRLNTTQTLADLAARFNNNLSFNDNKLEFTINNVDFSFDDTDTLSDMLNEVNASSAGVEIRYSEANDIFSVTAKQKGAGDNIIIENTGGNFFQATAGTSGSGIAYGTTNNGQDALFNLDGTNNVTRSDNNFTIDGVTYSLMEVDLNNDVTITVSQDVDSVYASIKSFVDKYNEIVDTINGKLSEETYREFIPLTDEQKEAMSETEIELWEKKAKSGLLRNDSELQTLLSNLRKAVFDPIDGVNGDLSQIGISTGAYSSKGKLIIDETTLKNYIQTNPDFVANLMGKESSIGYSPTRSATDLSNRYDEEGIANRWYDILQANIRTLRDTGGRKGILLEKAGLVGDVSEYTNTITKDMAQLDSNIDTLEIRLEKKSDSYYKKFAAMEKAISMLNSQAEWLSSQFGQQ